MKTIQANHTKPMLKVNKDPYTIFVVLLCTLFTVSCVTASSKQQRNTTKANPSLIICLGGGAKDRVEQSIKLLKKHSDINILFSGSSSFKYMADYAKKHYPKLKDNHIILEDRSYDTIGNAIYSRKLLEKRDFRNIILVTSDYHMKRSLYIFRRVFGPAYKITPSPSITNEAARKQQQEKEKKHLLYTKIMFAGIASGDIDGFEKRATLLDPKFPKPKNK